MKRILIAVPLLAMTFLVPALAQEKAGEVSYKIVKYDGVVDAVLKNRGKVVLVDFWADFCKPCKERFPGLVKFAKENAKKDLVLITVALDPMDGSLQPRDKTIAGIATFLKKQNATFLNLVLDEPEEVWEKFHLVGIPCVYVFDRDGKWSQFQPPDLSRNPEGPEELVLELLKK
jgi:thiol-disulfide isomerase/thioredoxin